MFGLGLEALGGEAHRVHGVGEDHAGDGHGEFRFEPTAQVQHQLGHEARGTEGRDHRTVHAEALSL